MKIKIHYLLPVVAAAGALFLAACGEKPAEEEKGEEKAAPKAEEKGEAKGEASTETVSLKVSGMS